ncbi:MAG: NAD(P)-binding domain-containing protein [Hyphomicrobium sp.]
MQFDPAEALYAAPLAVIWFLYERARRRESARSLEAKTASVESGRHEPASLHPHIDPGKCMGCGACVSACPEGDILGIINQRSELIEPSSCIGHGACMAACPFDAISLVFGTATRGVDLPIVDANFQTNVPGVYIAGELGGMGLIRNAIEQGRQAVDAISKRPLAKSPGAKSPGAGSFSPDGGMLDLVIIGCGPAGFSASLAALERGLSFKTFDQESLGGTVAHFPRGKIVMSRPAVLPMVGEVKLDRSTKEDLLDFWTAIQQKTGLTIHFKEGVEAVSSLGHPGQGFEIKTVRGSYRARAVLLTIGRRGSPRKLDVPGEDLPHVVYRLIDAEQYRRQHVVVVGGGDSAIEAAVSIAEQPGTTVTLSYRGSVLARCKAQNRATIEDLVAKGRITALLGSTVLAMTPRSVEIEHRGRVQKVPADAVIICAGGVLPSGFLRTIGIDIETKYGTS